MCFQRFSCDAQRILLRSSPPQTPTRRMILLDHSPAEITEWDETAISRSRTKETAKLDAVMLLARPLKAASPDAKHPGKAGIIPGGKARFPLGIVPWLSMGQKLSNLRFSQRNKRKVFSLPNSVFSLSWVQGPCPWRGV